MLVGQPATKRRRREGAAAVEFAMILPFLVAILLGMVEISRVLVVKEALSNAAQRGTRTASLPSGSNAQVKSDVDDIMTAAGLDGYSITVRVDDVVKDAATATRNQKVSVQVSIPTSKVFLISSIFIGGTTVQSETMAMLRQG